MKDCSGSKLPFERIVTQVPKIMNISNPIKILLIASISLILLTGCKEAEPTLSADTVLTSVALTVDASLSATPKASATATPTEIPTETSTPTASPTAQEILGTPTVSSTPAAATNCDSATFISDVTIQDGTQLAPETDFLKTWKIQNTGTCTWNANYAVVFVSGSAMDGTSPTFLLIDSAIPGSMVDITVEMTSPDTTGKFTGYWRMQNADGVAFGDTFYVEIEVVRAGETDHTPTATLVNTATATLTATETLLTETPTATATSE